MQATSFSGGYSKSTDKYEHGTVSLTTKGPIQVNITPGDLSIGPNQSKTWNGTVKADAAAGPEAGTSASATITGDYNIWYSRPAEMSGGGAVENTYYCATVGSTGDGCAFHGGNRGEHQIVHKIGTENVSIEVYSIKVTIGEIACDATLTQDVLTLNAEVFPAGGNLTWTLPDGSKASGNGITVPTGLLGNEFTVSAEYEIQGVTYKDTKKVTRNKLIGFKLPCCIDNTKNVKDIAILEFDGPCHPPVAFNPATLSPPAILWSSEENVTATCDGIALTASTNTVNTNKSINKTPVSIDFGAKVGEAMDKVFDALISGSPVNPCNKSGSLKPSGSISMEESRICCPDKDPCVQRSDKYSGAATWNYGVTCQFPIPAVSIPYIASLDLVVSAGFSAKVGVSYQTQCDPGGKFCVDAEASASFGGGVGATLLAGAIQANLQLIVDGITVKGSVCFVPQPTSGNASVTLGKLRVQGTVTAAWGLTSHSVDYTLFDGFSPMNVSF